MCVDVENAVSGSDHALLTSAPKEKRLYFFCLHGVIAQRADRGVTA
jgi:hypothetical protein